MLTFIAGMAAPSMAPAGFSEDLGIIKACGSDVWNLCSDVLPDVERVKSCVQNKMGQLSKGCLDKLLDAMAGAQFEICAIFILPMILITAGVYLGVMTLDKAERWLRWLRDTFSFRTFLPFR